MQQLLLLVAATALPILALIFVTALFAHKLYINVRSRYDIKVNCWFCNDNTRVSYAERNSWTCPHCDQYNGFNKDGDYNRDINSSRSSHNNNSSNSGSATVCANAYYTNELNAPPPAPTNGLCDQCNEAQRLKVEKLAQFEPKHESRFDQELKIYQKQLEQQFRLCGSCERHVNKVLHEKKKMVLGSKFLNFIIKGAALLKQPHFNRLARVQQQRRLQRYQFVMTLITIINVLVLLCNLPAATRNQFSNLLGETLGHALFFVYSHALTLFRVLTDSAGNFLSEQPLVARMMLFGGTFSKLLLYSLGLTQVQAQQATLSSCYTSVFPYAMLGLCFLHNIRDGLKFTRFTLLLVLWSIYAKGSFLLFEAIDGVNFLLLVSIFTLILLITNRKNSLLMLAHNESVGDSFHRLYADECISDDETISMLSQQLSCNNSSNHNGSEQQLRQRGQTHVAPSVLSLDSLRLSSQRTPHSLISPQLASPVPSYQASCMDNQQPWRHMNGATTYGWQRVNGALNGAVNGGFNGAYSGGISGTTTASTLCNSRPLTRSTNNLLFPSRLQQQQHHNGDITAWVNATSNCQRPLNILEEPSTASLLNCCEDKQQLSRTSSQSSGFESQLSQQQQQHHQQQQQHHQQQQQLFGQRVSNGAGGAVGGGGLLDMYDTLSQRQFPQRIPAPLISPYYTQSELHFDRHLNTQSHSQSHPQSASNPDIRPGDLLRKWLDHNTGSKQKSSG